MGEHELVTVDGGTLLRSDKRVDSSTVDEFETGEVKHDASGPALCVPKLSFQSGGRSEVDLAADGQGEAIGPSLAVDLQLARLGIRMGFSATQAAGSRIEG